MTQGRHPRRTRQTTFRPPHCPNPDCSGHLNPDRWRVHRAGWFSRPSDQKRFPRFRCLLCGRRFSSRTFSTTYWLRKRRLLPLIANLSANGAGIRQAARCLNVSHNTVARQLARLARHCLLFHLQLIQNMTLEEPLAIDGFETFEYSQFFPCHFHLAAGRNSWFLYYFSDSPLRRKGSMTSEQRDRRSKIEASLGRPDPKAIEKEMAKLISVLAQKLPPGRPLELHSDEHIAYPKAIGRAQKQLSRELLIQHQTVPSTQARTLHNPLFPVNLADLLLRHSHANHRRETIAFSKRRQAALERLAVFTVWRNLVKKRREKGGSESAGMVLGLVDRMLRWKDVLRKRLFPRHVDLPAPWESYYWRQVKTAVYGERQAEHRLRYAY